MRRSFRLFLALIVVVGTASFAARRAEAFHGTGEGERILAFQSDITVHEDASLTVTETMTVVARGREIKRGIYRDFPTDYRGRFGNRIVVDFDVERVLRDGRPEPYHAERRANGTRLYIGEEDVFLPAGTYTYTLQYRTTRQLGFFEDHDELYWNVTGNGWVFPMEHATATVTLPPGVPADGLRLAAFTGPEGARGTAFTSSVDPTGRAVFQTTGMLGSFEGLTIVVGWPKGFVREPTAREEIRGTLADNAGVIAGAAGFLIVVLYYLAVWHRVGRDPRRGTIIPRYTPPEGLSPAEMRYVTRMGFDVKALTAAIISMAVKGALTIRERDKTFTLMRRSEDVGLLAPEEREIAKRIFGSGRELALTSANHAIIAAATRHAKETLARAHRRVTFRLNRKYLVPGALISLLAFGASLLPFTEETIRLVAIGAFLLFWLAVLWKGVLALRVKRGTSRTLLRLSFTLLAVLGFFAFFVLGISPGVAILLLALSFVNGLFVVLLKSPTRAGRALLDAIEGFRLYLTVAEQRRLEFHNPPEKTPELFERYLPYALALGVEHTWAEQFADVFRRAAEAGRAYAPSWYIGASWRSFTPEGFASSLAGTFSGAIASSSRAPGSSSGFGGGSSGGGGGGGGGGGW